MKESLYRAGRTFLQAAAGYIAANLVFAVTSADPGDYDALGMSLIGLAASAIAAGLAALMNIKKDEDND